MGRHGTEKEERSARYFSCSYSGNEPAFRKWGGTKIALGSREKDIFLNDVS